MFAQAETQMAVEGGSCAHHVSYRPSAPIHLHLLLHLLVLTSFGRNENPPSSAFAFFLLAYSRLHQLNPAPHFFLFRPFFFPATLAFSHLQTALVPGQISIDWGSSHKVSATTLLPSLLNTLLASTVGISRLALCVQTPLTAVVISASIRPNKVYNRHFHSR